MVSESRPENGPSAGTVRANGTALHYQSVGSGTPIVMVPGGPGLGPAYLRPGMDRLADRFELVYYDPRGTGSTELGDPDLVTHAGAVDDLEALIDGLDIGRANLFGHSVGAELVALFCARRPDRVASAVLANPGPPFDENPRAEFYANIDQRRKPDDVQRLERLAESPAFSERDPATVEEYYRVWFLPFYDDREVGAGVSYGFTEITANNILDAMQRISRDLDPSTIMGELKAVRAPTLVVHAEHDPVPEAFTLKVAEAIPGAEYASISGANHFTYIEAPEPFFAVVEEFLQAQAG